MKGEGSKIPLKAGHPWPASETPFKWCFAWRADDSPTLNTGLVALRVFFQGTRTSIAKDPYLFLIFHGGMDPQPPPPPSESAHAWIINQMLNQLPCLKAFNIHKKNCFQNIGHQCIKCPLSTFDLTITNSETRTIQHHLSVNLV